MTSLHIILRYQRGIFGLKYNAWGRNKNMNACYDLASFQMYSIAQRLINRCSNELNKQSSHRIWIVFSVNSYFEKNNGSLFVIQRKLIHFSYNENILFFQSKFKIHSRELKKIGISPWARTTVIQNINKRKCCEVSSIVLSWYSLHKPITT